MATTIQNFFSRAADKQFARDFLLRVKQINVEGVSFNGETDLLYAKTAALPGRTIEDKTVNYFGQEFHVPGRSTYANAAGYSIEFFHDENVDHSFRRPKVYARPQGSQRQFGGGCSRLGRESWKGSQRVARHAHRCGRRPLHSVVLV